MLKKEIEDWLDKHQVTNYTIRDDLTIDVKGKVNLSNKKLIKLPVKFNHVSEDFNIFANELITLEGCPNVVVGSFAVNNNKLKSFNHSPEYVGGNFHCAFNDIKDFVDLKTEIKGTLYCDNNPIINLNSLQANIEKNVYFYQENNINFRLEGCEIFYDEKGFFNIPFIQVQKIQLRNKLSDTLEESKKLPTRKI
jgi:hypothetical protein